MFHHLLNELLEYHIKLNSVDDFVHVSNVDTILSSLADCFIDGIRIIYPIQHNENKLNSHGITWIRRQFLVESKATTDKRVCNWHRCLQSFTQKSQIPSLAQGCMHSDWGG